MRNRSLRPLQLLAGLALLGLLALALPLHVARAEGGPSGAQQSGACSGSYYTVKRGDTWSVIARREGISIANLKAANPQAVRARDLLYAGETICIPSATQAATPVATGVAQSGGYWYQVKAGDTWNKISRATGVSVRELWAANPTLLNRRQWLYIGQRVWIPDLTAGTATVGTATPGTATPAPTAAAATPVATAVVVTVETAMTATPISTVAATATPLATVPTTPTPVPVALATAAATATPVATATPTALPPKPSDCPKTLADYDASIARFLNTAGNDVAKLNRSLLLCRVAQGETPGAVSANITGAQSGDVVVAINDATAEEPTGQGALLVYHSGQKGYALAHKRAGQGRITLIEAADINQDGKADLVYSDTACGAHTCFGTLYVDSWDGKAYADWIEGEPTIAGPEYSVEDVSKDGQGQEVIVYGGVIGSVGAGPQRAWTEMYGSPAGGAYKLLSQVYAPSECLYHMIVDANRAFDAWALDGFDPAVEAYKAALAAKNPQACGTIQDEVKTLQDFARFRLVVADVAGGNATDAPRIAAEITHGGLKKAAATFMGSYTANTSVIQACRDVTELAETDVTTWQFLADWGYANPSFTAQELCPLN